MRKCSICRDPRRARIDRELARPGAVFRRIAADFGASETTVRRHFNNCVAETVERVKATQSKELEAAVQRVNREHKAEELEAVASIEVELRRCFTRINKLFDACDYWLSDPNEPDKYTLAPRADEIEVVYFEAEGDQVVRRKAPLQDLLARISKGTGVTIERWESRAADPRVLILKTAEQLGKQIDTLAKIEGRYKQPEEQGPATIQYSQLVLIVNQYRERLTEKR